MLTEFLKQFVHERPLLVMTACWIEGFVVGAFVIWWLL